MMMGEEITMHAKTRSPPKEKQNERKKNIRPQIPIKT